MTVTERAHQQSLGVTMDQSIPIEVLPNDRLADVTNARVRKPGGLYKRYGYNAYVRTKLSDGTAITTGKRFLQRENELAFTDGSYVYSYAAGLNRWVTRDRMPECQVLDRQPQVADQQKGDVRFTNVAQLLGQTCVVYQRFVNGTGSDIWARVFRGDTLIDETRLAAPTATLGPPDLITCGTFFVVIWDDGAANITARRWDTGDNTAPVWGTATVLRNDSDSSGFWAACEIPALSEFAIVYRRAGGGNQMDLYRFDATLASTANSTNLRAGKVFTLIGMRVIGTTITIGFVNTTDATVEAMGRVQSTLASAFAATVVLGAIADVAGPVVVGERTSLSAWILVRSTGTLAPPFVNQSGIRYRGIGVPSAAVDANTYNTYNCRHISHIWNYNGQSYVLVTNGASNLDITQTFAAVLNIGADEILAGDASYRGRPVARWGEAEIYAPFDTFPTRVPAGPTGGTFLLTTILADEEFQKVGAARGTTADVVTLNFDDTAATRWVGQSMIGGDTLIPGGMLHAYDGELCFEAGFTYYPVIREADPIVGAPGLANGTYEYVVCFVKRDKQGRLWRSRPSLPVLSGVAGDPDNTIRLRITHYSITSMHDSAQGFAHPVGIEVYRRQGTAPFVRLAQTGTDPSNVCLPSDPTSQAYFVFDDDGTWSTTNQPQLYTTGGVLENLTPRPCRYSQMFDNRLFLAGLDDDEVVQFSREIVGNEGAFFNLDQGFRVDDGQGIKALANQDSSLLLLKDDNDGIFYIQGNGPNDFGQESTYSDPRKIANAHGTIEPRSILTTSAGTFFQSRRGIELCGRGEGVQLFGEAIEDTLALLPMVTSCRYEPESGEVRWTLTNGTDGRIGVFTEPTKSWAQDVIYGGNGKLAVDATSFGGIYHWLGSDGYVYRESSDTGNHHDISVEASLDLVVSSSFTTGDIAPAGPLGKVSFYRVVLLGKRLTAHGLTLVVTLDQGQTNATAPGAKSFTAGEVSAFKWLPIELPLTQLTTQQGRSIRVSVTDTPTDEIGAGPIWFHLLVEYGTEREYQPLPVPTSNRK